MSEAPKTPKQQQEAAREARLAAALRQNLKRRKAQERGRDAAGDNDEQSDKA